MAENFLSAAVEVRVEIGQNLGARDNPRAAPSRRRRGEHHAAAGSSPPGGGRHARRAETSPGNAALALDPRANGTLDEMRRDRRSLVIGADEFLGSRDRAGRTAPRMGTAILEDMDCAIGATRETTGVGPHPERFESPAAESRFDAT